MTSSRRNYHLLVSGRVQGVFFRQSTRARAQELGCQGCVRNLADGRVEVLVSATAEAASALVDFCRSGPPSAVVEKLELRELDQQELLDKYGELDSNSPMPEIFQILR